MSEVKVKLLQLLSPIDEDKDTASVNALLEQAHDFLLRHMTGEGGVTVSYDLEVIASVAHQFDEHTSSVMRTSRGTSTRSAILAEVIVLLSYLLIQASSGSIVIKKSYVKKLERVLLPQLLFSTTIAPAQLRCFALKKPWELFLHSECMKAYSSTEHSDCADLRIDNSHNNLTQVFVQWRLSFSWDFLNEVGEKSLGRSFFASEHKQSGAAIKDLKQARSHSVDYGNGSMTNPRHHTLTRTASSDTAFTSSTLEDKFASGHLYTSVGGHAVKNSCSAPRDSRIICPSWNELAAAGVKQQRLNQSLPSYKLMRKRTALTSTVGVLLPLDCNPRINHDFRRAVRDRENVVIQSRGECMHHSCSMDDDAKGTSKTAHGDDDDDIIAYETPIKKVRPDHSAMVPLTPVKSASAHA